MTSNILSISSCKVCGSTRLAWRTSIVNPSDVQQGRLNTRDVDCQFFLGCEDCSETLATISANKVAGLMNEGVLEMLDMADQQLRGFGHAIKGYGVRDLVSSMGLKAEEWNTLRDRAKVYLPEECVEEIDEYF